MEEEGDIYDGVRAQFPLSFGKQSKPQTPLEAIHNATRRSNSNPKTANDLPSVSSSSRDWLNSLRPPKTPTPPPPLPPPDHDDGPMVGPPPPPPTAADEEEDDDDAEMIGPPPPPPIASESEDDSDQDEVGTRFRIPLSNEIVLKGHTKVVSALAVDHTGSRVLSGSYDYMVRMYDFQGMNARLESFRQLEPFEGHQVRNLSWSPTADRFLCVTGSAQAKIYDRDGLTLGEFVKGDMYIRDLKNTKGHISGLTCGEWHPKTKETILTSSEDGSLRIWDVNDFKSQKQVIKPKLARPGRVPVTTCAWDHDGKCIAGGIGDGSIQVWDLRKTKEPLKVFEDLPNHYAQTNIAFSPDERLFLTGTSVERESMTGGLLCFFDRVNLELVSKVGISPTCSVVQCSWHPKLNQIFATTGDKSQGGTHILYDPTVSERGALVCVARAPRKKSIDDFEAKPVIHNPHALPLFRDQPSRKRQREKVLKDPLKSHKPELPMTGPGFGGRVGTSQGSLLTQYLLKKGGMIKETWMEEDPREAILKYADAAAKDPKFIAPAYAETQPEPVFAKSDSEDEEK
ncbi:WD repeat-containing protein 70 isoform B [Glycine soja]|uniref:WD repeat-containing protein 70 isoform B n=1 Tax=Glycine soja TaxID=3848 RepID=A0A445FHJ7_GLYSO|nr:WD repeat-containing protein 70 isoform B [Glycine soja]